MRIVGRLVLITGASSGIGAATARAVVRRGGRVLLLARTASALEEVAAQLRAQGGEAWVYPVDLSDAAAVERVAGRIMEEVGVPDVLINNAGAGRWLSIEETPPGEAVEMMASPYFGAFYITRAFLPAMRRRGSGHIVNLTSPAAFVAWPGATAYTVARWAMRGFTEALRAELHATAITVSLAVPSLVQSSYFENNPGVEERVPRLARLFRILTPEQVAAGIVRGIERNRGEIFIPRALSAILRLHRVLPRPIEWLVVRSAPRQLRAAPENR